MKRILSLFVLSWLPLMVTAGGLITNTCQSAQYARMLSRNASTQIDAVYYNPAGLAKFYDGWFFSVNNLGIMQKENLNSGFPLLHDGDYTGNSTGWVIPSFYGLYSRKKWAFSLGYGMTAGGSQVKYDRGIPSFDIDISKKLMSENLGASAYRSDISLSTGTFFHGIQIGATYALNNNFSIYGGIRFVSATRNFQLSISDVMVKAGDNQISASSFLTNKGNAFRELATDAQKISDWLQKDYISIGAGSYDLVTLIQAGYMTEAQKNQIVSTLSAYHVAGITDTWSVSKFKTEYDKVASSSYAAGTKCIEDAETLEDNRTHTRQSGTGWTPVFGFNLSPSNNLNISTRIEYKTKIKLTNHTGNSNRERTDLFPDAEEIRNDFPSLFAFGIGYRFSESVEAQLSYNLWFDKYVDWGINFRESYVYHQSEKRIIDNNMYELALGIQFRGSENLEFSLGGLISRPVVTDSYQSDFSFISPSWSVAGGVQWKLSNRLVLDAGLTKTVYEDVSVSYNDPEIPGGIYNDTYRKKSLGFAAGLTFSITQ